VNKLAFHHLYKCGGLYIVNRYQAEPGFAYCRRPDEIVLNYGNPVELTRHPVAEAEQLGVTVVMGHGVTPQLAGDYAHAAMLRDPIRRVVSGYNFHRLEMNLLYGVHTTVDFDSWFINRERVLPSAFHWQYSHWGDTQEHAEAGLRDMDHVFILGRDHITGIDRLFQQYGLAPDPEWTLTHNTADSLSKLGMRYITWADLSSDSKQRVLDEIEPERDFYKLAMELAGC